MRLLFWVTAFAVLSITWAKNSTAKTKPKRQLDDIRSPQNLQYSLVLPHSRVAHFRSLTNNRRISHATPKGKLPPYAVQMEPVVQYSQKDPLYDPNHDNIDDSVLNKNEIHAQSKILNVQDQSAESSFGPPYGSLPTAPLYSHEPHPQYYEAPEPIIEIIIKESNESLPAPPPPPVQKKKKEPVHVFYVKYSKDPHSKDKVVYEKPIPAITPPSNDEDDHHNEYVTVTPEPSYVPAKTTTLRAIIKPESEVYHSDSSVRITFGNEGRHYSARREEDVHTEDHEETAPRPAIAFPNQPPQHNYHSVERTSPPEPQYHESATRPTVYHPIPSAQTYKSGSPQAQSRIQFQPQYFPTEQQLPRQGPSATTFRSQSHISRQPFGSSPSIIPNPAFSNGPTGPIFSSPTVSSPIGPAFPTAFQRTNPSFPPRPSGPPPFGSRQQFNGPPRTSFHSGPQRPFQQPQPQKSYFDEAKYLQENYHTITTEQVDPPKDQQPPNRPTQNFNLLAQPSPSPTAAHFQEHNRRPPTIPFHQQLPQQKQPQQFQDTFQNKPSHPVSPSTSPFFNLRPSPPHIGDSRPPFHQPSLQQLGFHQGPQPSSRPSSQHSFSSVVSPSSAPLSQNQFLPLPSAPTLYNFHPQPSQTPEQQHQFHHQSSPSERPQFQQSHGPTERPFQQSHSPSERPTFSHQNNFPDTGHQQNIHQFVPNGGELVAAIPKYEQHITEDGSSASFSGLGETHPSPTPNHSEQQYHHAQQQQQQQHQHQQKQQHQHQQQQQKQQQQQHQQHQQQQQQEYHDSEQEQIRLQLAQNVQKQQEEIHRLQSQLLLNQQHHQVQQYEQNYRQGQSNYNQQVQATSPRSQYIQERSRAQSTYAPSTSSPPYYQSTSRTVEITPTTQKYVSSTANVISTADEAKKEEKKKKPSIELPDEVPDDLRQQLLSSGILDNADISVLDYDKVGDTSLDSLPPDQLANFFSAGGAQQISASQHRPIIVKPNGDRIESRIDEDIMEEDQDGAASENVASYVDAPSSEKQAVEMKVVHFDPKTPEGQQIANDYVQENATQVEPVALNDKKYNRYLPLKVSGNQFPLPDILKGRKITSVVVLAPVETEVLGGDHVRTERAASNNLKGIKFVAGDSLQNLLKKPTRDNFEKWLNVEKETATDLQSIILLVTGNDEPTNEKEIFMYDIASGNVNKLSGELSNAFVEAAENNSLSKDIETLAIEGDGTPENFKKDLEHIDAEGSENVPLFVDLSGVSLDQEKGSQVSISSGYSKTKLGRSLRRRH